MIRLPELFVSGSLFLYAVYRKICLGAFGGLILVSLPDAAFGQSNIGDPAPVAENIGLSVGSSGAAYAGRGFNSFNRGRQGLVIEPRVSVVGTYTDNAALSATEQHSDLIVEINPGIRVSNNGGRVRGVFDYSIRNLIYTNGSQGNSLQHALNSFATVEAVDNWAFIDLSGNVSRQSISAFGTQASDASRNTSNSTQVSTYTFSPYVRSAVGATVNYELRFRRAGWHTNSSSVSNAQSSEWLGTISQEYPSSRLGWLLRGTTNQTNYSTGRNAEADRVRGVLTFFATPQLRLFVSGGQESNNYLSVEKQRYNNSGYGFLWRPSERTRIEAERERRFFGNGHQILLEYRTRSSALRYSDAKDVSVNPALSGSAAAPGSLFDLLFNQFALIEPDPVRRAQLVNTYVQANGLDPNTTIQSGLLQGAITLQRVQQLSFSLLRARDTYSVFANRTETRRLDPLVAITDDFSLAELVEQRGIGITYSRKLTPLSVFNAFAAWQRSTSSLSIQKSTLQTYSLTYSRQLAPKVAAGIGLRRTLFDSELAPYKEFAVFGSITMSF